MTPIAPHIEAYLREHLAHQRDASPHTCNSYAYTFQLLFEFAAARHKVGPSALVLEQLDSDIVGSFLEYLEDKRRNAAETRNVRLAAIKSFFRYLEHRRPAALEQIRRILAIPFKKTNTRLVPYLLREEVQALLDAPDPTTRDGLRDRAMLHLAVCAGLRVSELTGLRMEDLAFPSMSIHVHGKGRRERAMPLWKTAATALRAWLAVRNTVPVLGGVRELPRRTNKPLGFRLYSQAARASRQPTLSRFVGQADLTARVEAHLRDDCASGNTRHSKGLALAGA